MEQTPATQPHVPLLPMRLLGTPRQRHSHRCTRSRCGGFSLIELLVVIAVTVALTAMMMPALRHVHENAHRLICGAHLAQLGQAFYMYYDNNGDRLPHSRILAEGGSPADLMAAQRALGGGEWDGIGRLYALGYCPSPECFYCPSHHGNHAFDKYADMWNRPPSNFAIYTNYHYAGDVDWVQTNQRRSLDGGYSLVLATDGLRTSHDFNHFDGMNILRGDGSVRWRDDTENIRSRLPINEYQPPSMEYDTLWDEVTKYY